MFCFLYALFFPYLSSSSLSLSLSTLELLPNELLVEILSYLSISDLFYGWLNLNWRFNTILHNLRIKKVYNEPKGSWWQQWWYSWRNPSDVAPLHYFASQLVCLQAHKCLSSSDVNKINVLAYPNLRILTLHQLNPAQLHIIQKNNFPHLERLSLIDTKHFNFEILCQFNSLRSCDVWSLEIGDKYSCSSLSLRSLILHQCDPLNLIYLLRQLPQMTSLKVNIFWNNTFVDKFDSTAVFVHPNFKSLEILMSNHDHSGNEINADRCDVVLALLACMLPDKRIRCRLALFDMSNFNFELFQTAVEKFKFFRFSCLLVYFIEFHPVPNFDRIQQLPLFNRLQSDGINSKIAVTYRSQWANAYHGVLK